MKHCKEHDIPYDEMGYCAVGCSGWAEGDGGMNKINPDELSQPMGCFKCKHIHSKDITCLEYQQAIVNHHKAVIAEFEKEVKRVREWGRTYRDAYDPLKEENTSLIQEVVELRAALSCVNNELTSGLRKSAKGPDKRNQKNTSKYKERTYRNKNYTRKSLGKCARGTSETNSCS